MCDISSPIPVTPLQGAGKTHPSTERRRRNIDFIAGLDRTGLAYGVRERQLVISTTAAGEEISIQYPGKESARAKDRRPWDFRPRIRLSDGTPMRDYSFYDIWDCLYRLRSVADSERTLPVVATTFYRMAFLLDHEPVSGHRLRSRDVRVTEGAEMAVGERSGPECEFLRYKVPASVTRLLAEEAPALSDGLSWEAFLVLNDLLAWNEDCKYHFRNVERAGVGVPPTWIADTGRPRNLLSHVCVIGLAMDIIDLKTVLMRASRSRGTFAATREDVQSICSPWVA